MKVSLKTITPESEVNIVEIARVSSPRIDKTEKPEGLISYCIKNKHWSIFEHSHMTIEVETSISISVQYLRHVSFRFQQFSQRYAAVEKIEPIEFRLQAEKNRQSSTEIIGSITHLPEISANAFEVSLDDLFVESNSVIEAIKFFKWMEKASKNLNDALDLYKEGLDLGIAKETCRFILPLATSTKLYMTGNIRSWIHLLDVRDDGHAQKEAMLIAKEIKKIFKEQCPIISKALNY